MHNCHRAFGVRISLTRASGAAAPGKASVQIQCENYSMVPVDVVLRRLLCTDPSVAEAEGVAHKTVYLSRRGSLSHVQSPTTTASAIGTWRPVATGTTSIQATLHLLDARYFLLSTLTPSVEVEVTGEEPVFAAHREAMQPQTAPAQWR